MLTGVQDARVRGKLFERMQTLAIEPEAQGKAMTGRTTGVPMAHLAIRRVLSAVATTAGLLVAGCGSSTSSAATATRTATASVFPASASTSSNASTSSTLSGAGSSSATAAPTPTPPIDTCALVTAAEASAITGAAVHNLAGPGGPTTPGGCAYGSLSVEASVTVLTQVYPDAASAAAALSQQLTNQTISNPKPVTGIGDKAIEFTLTNGSVTGTDIYFIKGNVLVIVAVFPPPSSSAIEALASTAAGRV